MNKINFLSVSALNMFLTQPNKFYCTRLAEEKLPRDPQSLAAAAGTMFDINIKKFLISICNLGNYNSTTAAVSAIKDRFINFPWFQKEKENMTLSNLFLESLEEQNRIDEIFIIGRKLFNVYINSPLYKKTSFHDIEKRSIFNLKVKISNKEYVVPIYAILDCVLSDKGVLNGNSVSKYYPMDFKVSGYTSGASPKKAYHSSYDELGNSFGAHKDYVDDMDFSLIDETWAMQGCTYGWSIGCELFKPFPFSVHALFIGTPKQDGSRSIKLCEYNGIITEEFQKITALKYINAWNTLKDNSEVPWCEEPLLSEMLSRTEHFGW